MPEQKKTKKTWKYPDSLIPLIYLIAVALIGGGLHYLKVPPELTGLIVGAGITRVKISKR